MKEEDYKFLSEDLEKHLEVICTQAKIEKYNRLDEQMTTKMLSLYNKQQQCEVGDEGRCCCGLTHCRINRKTP